MFAMLENLLVRPCLVLGHADPVYAAATSRAFGRQGWDVYQAATGPEARRLARICRAQVVVLDTDLPGESGWLTCAKLLQERPEVKVLLVSGYPQPGDLDFCAFVGAAALLPRSAGVGPLLELAREIDLVPVA
jgi:ActR/RegA family two-component response regulator